MDDSVRTEILSASRHLHALTEQAYQHDASVPGDAGWADKQRTLLADMALHLLQTALRPGDLPEDGLKRNLYAILSIADGFVRGHDLKAVADTLYDTPEP